MGFQPRDIFTIQENTARAGFVDICNRVEKVVFAASLGPIKPLIEPFPMRSEVLLTAIKSPK